MISELKKLRGGYKINLAGKPADGIILADPVDRLSIPRSTNRCNFRKLIVSDGDEVSAGDTLAIDPKCYDLPLLAPRAGTVSIPKDKRRIILSVDTTDADKTPSGSAQTSASAPSVNQIFKRGGWEFITDAFTNALPDPAVAPVAVIVSTLSLEPYLARGDVQIRADADSFIDGLNKLCEIADVPVYVVCPDIVNEFSDDVQKRIAGISGIKKVLTPLKYPFDHPALIARRIGLNPSFGTVWYLRTEGVFAVHRALTLSKPVTQRLITVGGSAIDAAVHVSVPVGYPIDSLLQGKAVSGSVRVIDGGVLTGRIIEGVKPSDGDTADAGIGTGIASDCRGITVIPEVDERELLGFMRPGLDRKSYSSGFLSSLRGFFYERLSSALRGEARPCVSCGFCEDICPAGLMPHLVHKYCYQDDLDEAVDAGIMECVRCGLCAYVCPSKLDLQSQFDDMKTRAVLEGDTGGHG